MQAQEKEKTLDNHFDIIEQFSTIKSKSRQIVLMAKRNMANNPAALDSIRFRYMNLKSHSDGAISRYKAMIDNPTQAKKAGVTIDKSINETVEELNGLTKFYLENGTTGMGLKPIPGLGIINTVIGGIGGGIFNEIKNMQKSKRDETKAELDQYILPDFDDVK